MKSLRDYRIRADLTQDELAERAQIRVATISSLENGKSQPRKATLEKLAKVLKTNPEDLATTMRADQAEEKQGIIQQVEGDWLFLTGLDKDLRTGLAQSLLSKVILSQQVILYSSLPKVSLSTGKASKSTKRFMVTHKLSPSCLNG